MTDLRKLTEQYVTAFNARDISGVAALCSDDFCLTDPSVKDLAPREKVIEYMMQIFNENPALRFHAKNILVDENISVIHFTLALEGKSYTGVDFIEWEREMMIRMTAFLSPEPERVSND